jgi:hypothetical protein
MLHGQFRPGIASRFLGEIPPQLLKAVNSRRTRALEAVSKNVASGCQPREAGAQELGQINFVLSNAGLSVPEFNFVNFIQVYSLLGLP